MSGARGVGIHLGLTEACTAISFKQNDARVVDVVRNNENEERTPCAVWVRERGRLQVGQRAIDRMVADPENVALEFVCQLGERTRRHFPRSDLRLNAEELVAEVLKSLALDVQQRSSDHVMRAVLAVPTGFDHDQQDALRRAAGIAGLSDTIVIPEAVAAVHACTSCGSEEDGAWLVFHSASSLSVSIILALDGRVEEVAAVSDAALGMRQVDALLVENFLAPALRRMHRLDDFRADVPQRRLAWATLAREAARARTRLARAHEEELITRVPGADGEWYDLECKLHRSDLERLMKPLLEASVALCRRALTAACTSAADLDGVLMLGEGALHGIVREHLVDPHGGLGIALIRDIDPLIAPARGAALYAVADRAVSTTAPAPSARTFALGCQYETEGTALQPLVRGRVMAPTYRSLAGWTLEITDPEHAWSSGRVVLASDGSFAVPLRGVRGRTVVYRARLFDEGGTAHTLAPATLTYTAGAIASADVTVLERAVGIVGPGVPATTVLSAGWQYGRWKRITVTTAALVSRWENKPIPFDVIECGGESGGKVRILGAIKILPHQLWRDLPAGSKVDIALMVDDSRLVRARAHVPLLDVQAEAQMSLD